MAEEIGRDRAVQLAVQAAVADGYQLHPRMEPSADFDTGLGVRGDRVAGWLVWIPLKDRPGFEVAMLSVEVIEPTGRIIIKGPI